jgi:hypothetical protein
MNQNKFIVFILSLLTITANAAIVCEGTGPLGGQMKVTINQRDVVVEGGALNSPVTFRDVSIIYDGHETSLITAPGLAIRYADDYGCIQKVAITTDMMRGSDFYVGFIATLHIEKCRGGSSPDSNCGFR